ncbi:histidine kinase [Colwellia psychrerythraea]|uniref:Histidine kinase n=1 Tax=Colwellia psychrerythraea TaxID=28229 RepID=A0A1Y5EFW0_COLPS|nr:histidine kinase [Colwellia psychrerythraea]
MNINLKLQLVTIVPLVLALVAVLIVTQVQYQSLSEQTVNEYRQSVMSHRKDELRSYVALAEGATEHIYKNKNLSNEQAKSLVKQVLSNMRFGKDGYFFAYNFDGTALLIPGQEWRIGKNWFDLEDRNGVKLIQGLIEQAKSGGGYLNYVFNQPSKGGEVGKKIGYSRALEDWQWMIGTGVYIDDIDQEIAVLNASIGKHIRNTSVMTLIIGLVAVITIFFTGQFIRFSERKLANRKLRELNERIFQTQEEECKRVSRELHDGISQTIAAARFSLETAQLKHQNNDDASNEMDRSMELICKIMGDIRAISHQLHPGLLEDYGLGAALEELGRDFSQRTGIQVDVERLSLRNILSTEVKTALYRIAQESLTNIERHANASKVSITLKLMPSWLVLEIIDNGQGFDYQRYDKIQDKKTKVHQGIGLRNMKERLSFYQGDLTVKSEHAGTKVSARIPQSQLRFNASNASEN